VLIPPSVIDGKPYIFEASGDPATLASRRCLIGSPSASPTSRSRTSHADERQCRSGRVDEQHPRKASRCTTQRAIGSALRSPWSAVRGDRRAVGGDDPASTASRDDRWRERFAEIPKLANSAIEKFRGAAPGPDSSPDEWPSGRLHAQARSASACSGRYGSGDIRLRAAVRARSWVDPNALICRRSRYARQQSMTASSCAYRARHPGLSPRGLWCCSIGRRLRKDARCAQDAGAADEVAQGSL